jgi:hypothetical protein
VRARVINDLGDFTHYENFTATTEASGHALDYDSRFPKMIKAYAGSCGSSSTSALTKAARRRDHQPGQPLAGPTTSGWRCCCAQLRAHGRVNVLDNDSVFIGYRMGNTLVMTTTATSASRPAPAGVMTADFRKDFGETEFHYIDIGHVHHRSVSQGHQRHRRELEPPGGQRQVGARGGLPLEQVHHRRAAQQDLRRDRPPHLPIAEVRDRLYGGRPRHASLKKPAFLGTRGRGGARRGPRGRGGGGHGRRPAGGLPQPA